MRKLITLISTKEKSPEEAAREVVQNFQKYEGVKAQVESQMKKLYPKDLGELVKTGKEFSSKPAAEQEQHQHNWEQVVIAAQAGFGVFNDRTVECCFVCGKVGGRIFKNEESKQ